MLAGGEISPKPLVKSENGKKTGRLLNQTNLFLTVFGEISEDIDRFERAVPGRTMNSSTESVASLKVFVILSLKTKLTVCFSKEQAVILVPISKAAEHSGQYSE